MANGHGGRRENSGRKKISDKHAEAIESVTDLCAAHAKPAFHRLWELIDPQPRYEEEYVPAALLTRKGLATDGDGEIIRDDKGKPSIVEVRIFPGLGDDDLVLVKKKKLDHFPEVKAIRELFDRFMGRPSQAIELNNGDDGPLKIEVVYADADPPSDAPEAPRGPAEDPPGDPPL